MGGRAPRRGDHALRSVIRDRPYLVLVAAVALIVWYPATHPSNDHDVAVVGSAAGNSLVAATGPTGTQGAPASTAAAGAASAAPGQAGPVQGRGGAGGGSAAPAARRSSAAPTGPSTGMGGGAGR